MNLTDTQARIILLLLYGLEYDEIRIFLGIAAKSVRNSVYEMCSTLELSGVFHLLEVARKQGFDSRGNVDTIQVMDAVEYKRLLQRFPSSRRKKVKATKAVS